MLLVRADSSNSQHFGAEWVKSLGNGARTKPGCVMPREPPAATQFRELRNSSSPQPGAVTPKHCLLPDCVRGFNFCHLQMTKLSPHFAETNDCNCTSQSLEVQEACADKQRHGEPAERAKGREIKAQPHVGHNLEKQKGIADPDGVAQGQLVRVSQTRQQAAASQTEAAIKNPQQVGARQECSCVIALLALNLLEYIFLTMGIEPLKRTTKKQTTKAERKLQKLLDLQHSNTTNKHPQRSLKNKVYRMQQTAAAKHQMRRNQHEGKGPEVSLSVTGTTRDVPAAFGSQAMRHPLHKALETDPPSPAVNHPNPAEHFGNPQFSPGVPSFCASTALVFILRRTRCAQGCWQLQGSWAVFLHQSQSYSENPLSCCPDSSFVPCTSNTTWQGAARKRSALHQGDEASGGRTVPKMLLDLGWSSSSWADPNQFPH
ncbi:hypothetical protein Anapl_04016 [Anas platyrhynchos]|uniref:Uncharacterized protein n=1 Tax=Anas platyrhynchos TaxID=8839 RepID=R0LLN5_ANAPL|nr:hypothetical protein Anapl_04016 [Anas platyrhynchos]